jgi:fumarate hydratase, class I
VELLRYTSCGLPKDVVQLVPPEAMWQLEVKDFPAVITMDSHGGSLHTDVEAQSAAAAARLMEANPFK